MRAREFPLPGPLATSDWTTEMTASDRTCPRCGAAIVGRTARAVFCSTECSQAYRRAMNRDSKREYNAAYYQANRDQMIADARRRETAQRQADPEQFRAASRRRQARYRSLNPERVSATNAATYAARRGAILVGDRDISWRSLYERDGATCHLCRKKVGCSPGTHRNPRGSTVDHLVPLSAGGDHGWHNVALACWQCNIARGARGAAQLRLV
jgi:5-methylcytosine-specific restriction endonuclease McrA